MTSQTIIPLHQINGEMTVPGDKSITHRVIILSAIAQGTSTIYGYSSGQDCMTSLQVIQDLGVKVEKTEEKLIIQGVGLYGLISPSRPLDCANSGTTMRLMMGLLSGANIEATLIGDASLSKRPMARVATPLIKMGANIKLSDNNTAPVIIQHNQGIEGIEYAMPVASAQVKSAILLASLYADNETAIKESAITRNHTEQLLSYYGQTCIVKGLNVQLKPGSMLSAVNYEVPGDFSSAAFWIVAACIIPNSILTIRNVGLNSTRTGLLAILKLMGADITVNVTANIDDCVGDITIQYTPLHAIPIPQSLISLAIDEFPIIFVAVACATGVTEIRGLEELRHKETDRIQAMVTNLKALGIDIQELSDGAIIHGGELSGGVVDSYGDHRIAMAMAIAALKANSPVTIKNATVIEISYPEFYTILESLYP